VTGVQTCALPIWTGAVLAAAVYARSVGKLAVVGLVGVATILIVLTTGFVNLTTVEAMVNFDDESSIQHQEDLKLSLVAIREYPFGRGLGTAGNIGQQQLGGEGLTNES